MWILFFLICVYSFGSCQGRDYPDNLACSAVNSSAIAVTWSQATDTTVAGYHLDIERVDGLKVELGLPSIELNLRTYEAYTYHGLGAYATYEVTIHSYFTSGGNGTDYVLTCQTASALPDAATFNLTCWGVSTTEIQCEWETLGDVYWNGIQIGYELQYIGLLNDQFLTVNFSTSESSYLVQGLTFYTKYILMIRSVNDVGLGPFTSDTARTLGWPVKFENETRYYCYEAVPGTLEFSWLEMPCTIYVGIILGLLIICIILMLICCCSLCCKGKSESKNNVSVNIFNEEGGNDYSDDDDYDDESEPEEEMSPSEESIYSDDDDDDGYDMDKDGKPTAAAVRAKKKHKEAMGKDESMEESEIEETEEEEEDKEEEEEDEAEDSPDISSDIEDDEGDEELTEEERAAKRQEKLAAIAAAKEAKAKRKEEKEKQKEEKAKLKAEKTAEKEKKKAEREAKKKEREAEKAKKDAERKEKNAEKEAKKAERKANRDAKKDDEKAKKNTVPGKGTDKKSDRHKKKATNPKTEGNDENTSDNGSNESYDESTEDDFEQTDGKASAVGNKNGNKSKVVPLPKKGRKSNPKRNAKESNKKASKSDKTKSKVDDPSSKEDIDDGESIDSDEDTDSNPDEHEHDSGAESINSSKEDSTGTSPREGKGQLLSKSKLKTTGKGKNGAPQTKGTKSDSKKENATKTKDDKLKNSKKIPKTKLPKDQSNKANANDKLPNSESNDEEDEEDSEYESDEYEDDTENDYSEEDDDEGYDDVSSRQESPEEGNAKKALDAKSKKSSGGFFSGLFGGNKTAKRVADSKQQNQVSNNPGTVKGNNNLPTTNSNNTGANPVKRNIFNTNPRKKFDYGDWDDKHVPKGKGSSQTGNANVTRVPLVFRGNDYKSKDDSSGPSFSKNANNAPYINDTNQPIGNDVLKHTNPNPSFPKGYQKLPDGSLQRLADNQNPITPLGYKRKENGTIMKEPYNGAENSSIPDMYANGGANMNGHGTFGNSYVANDPRLNNKNTGQNDERKKFDALFKTNARLKQTRQRNGKVNARSGGEGQTSTIAGAKGRIPRDYGDGDNLFAAPGPNNTSSGRNIGHGQGPFTNPTNDTGFKGGNKGGAPGQGPNRDASYHDRNGGAPRQGQLGTAGYLDNRTGGVPEHGLHGNGGYHHNNKGGLPGKGQHGNAGYQGYNNDLDPDQGHRVNGGFHGNSKGGVPGQGHHRNRGYQGNSNDIDPGQGRHMNGGFHGNNNGQGHQGNAGYQGNSNDIDPGQGRHVHGGFHGNSKGGVPGQGQHLNEGFEDSNKKGIRGQGPNGNSYQENGKGGVPGQGSNQNAGYQGNSNRVAPGQGQHVNGGYHGNTKGDFLGQSSNKNVGNHGNTTGGVAGQGPNGIKGHQGNNIGVVPGQTQNMSGAFNGNSKGSDPVQSQDGSAAYQTNRKGGVPGNAGYQNSSNGRGQNENAGYADNSKTGIPGYGPNGNTGNQANTNSYNSNGTAGDNFGNQGYGTNADAGKNPKNIRATQAHNPDANGYGSAGNPGIANNSGSNIPGANMKNNGLYQPDNIHNRQLPNQTGLHGSDQMGNPKNGNLLPAQRNGQQFDNVADVPGTQTSGGHNGFPAHGYGPGSDNTRNNNGPYGGPKNVQQASTPYRNVHGTEGSKNNPLGNRTGGNATDNNPNYPNSGVTNPNNENPGAQNNNSISNPNRDGKNPRKLISFRSNDPMTSNFDKNGNPIRRESNAGKTDDLPGNNNDDGIESFNVGDGTKVPTRRPPAGRFMANAGKPAWNKEKASGASSNRKGAKTPVENLVRQPLTEPEPVFDTDRLARKFPFLDKGTAGETKDDPKASDNQMRKNKSDSNLLSRSFVKPNAPKKDLPDLPNTLSGKDAEMAKKVAEMNPEMRDKIFYGFGVGKWRLMATTWLNKWKMKKRPVKTEDTSWD